MDCRVVDMENLVTDDGLQPEISSILQTVFMSCDERADGAVKVSKFLSFLKEKAGASEIFEFLDDLRSILDVQNTDPAIDWSHCKNGMQLWIKQLNNRNSTENLGSAVYHSTPNMKLIPTDRLKPMAVESLLLGDGKKSPIVATTYSNDSMDMDIGDPSWSNSDAENRVEELEIKNKRLIEDNVRLKEDLNLTEDFNSSVQAENEKLQTKLSRCERLLEENKIAANHYNELKVAVLEYQAAKKELEEKVLIIERENSSLKLALEDYEKKFTQMDGIFEILKEERNKMQEQLTNKKVSTNKSDHMNCLIAELSIENEMLRVQKSTAARELSEVKRELSSHNFSTINAVDGIHTSILSSTRFETSTKSLEQELNAEMLQVDDLKIAEIAQRREHSEKRTARLIGTLKALEDENRCLLESRDKVIRNFGSLTIASMEDQERLKELQNEVQKEKRLTVDLNEEMIQLKDRHDIEIKELQEQLRMAKHYKNESRELLVALEQIKDLKKLVDNLESRNLDTARKIFDLEEKLSRKEKELLQEKERVASNENLLCTVCKKHEDELRLLMHMVSHHSSYSLQQSTITFADVASNLSQFMDEFKQVRRSPDGICRETVTSNGDCTEAKHDSSIQFQYPSNKSSLVSRECYRDKQMTRDDGSMTSSNGMNDEGYSALPVPSEIPCEERKCSSDTALSFFDDRCSEDVFTPPSSALLQMSSSSDHSNDDNSCTETGNTGGIEVKGTVDSHVYHSLPVIQTADAFSSGISDNPESAINSAVESDEYPISRRNLSPISNRELLHSADEVDKKRVKKQSGGKNNFLSISVGNIVEFDRSDMSSDSEAESKANRRVSLIRRRVRSVSRKSKSVDESRPIAEEEPPKKETHHTLRQRRRRCGVSAEPVRVSWSSLRESLKQSQVDNEASQEPSSTITVIGEVNEEEACKEDEVPSEEATLEIVANDSSEEMKKVDNSITSIPTIEISDDSTNEVSELETNCVPPSGDALSDQQSKECEEAPNLSPSPMSSLQVPRVGKACWPRTTLSVEYTDPELEKKYRTVLISFQTDQYTLPKRLEHQERARDVAESGMDKELMKLSSTFTELQAIRNTTPNIEDQWSSLHKQVEILRKAAMKVSAQSEQHGCYQQESRAAPNIDIMIAYAEHLRMIINKLKEELGMAQRNLRNAYMSDSADLSDIETSKSSTNDRQLSSASWDGENSDKKVESKDTRETISKSFKGASNALMVHNRLKKMRSESPVSTCNEVKRVSFSSEPTEGLRTPSNSTVKKTSSLLGSVSCRSCFSFQTVMYAFFFSFFCLLVYILVNNAEVDVVRLHELVLQYIPHTITYESADEER